MAHNIMENDGILTVGARPWHNLGVNLATPPSSGEDAVRIAGLDWRVSKQPIFLRDGTPVQIEGAVSKKRDAQYGAVIREDTGQILGVVGPNYVPFQNEEMAKLFNPLINSGQVTIETCGSLFNGKKVWMLGKFGETQVNKNDRIGKYILLSHGHDGLSAIRFGFVPIRVVCWNTLSLAMNHNSSKLVKLLHTSSTNNNLEILRDSMVLVDEMFELTTEQFRMLASKKVSRNDLEKYANIIIRGDKNPTDKPTKKQELKIEKIINYAINGIGNSGNSWWDAYNGVSEFLTWENGRKLDNRINSLWFGNSKNILQNSFELALKMAS